MPYFVCVGIEFQVVREILKKDFGICSITMLVQFHFHVTLLYGYSPLQNVCQNENIS